MYWYRFSPLLSTLALPFRTETNLGVHALGLYFGSHVFSIIMVGSYFMYTDVDTRSLRDGVCESSLLVQV